MPDQTIKKCYKKSIELLEKNSSVFGSLACSEQKKAKERNYLGIFSRDASICAMGMISTKNKALIRLAKRSLLTLSKHQAEDGEIPNYVKPELPYTDFWRLGSVDATLWWLIALDFYNKNSGDKKLKTKLDKKIKKAIIWLRAHEHNKDFLLVQGEASDWADIMPRNGRVLYSNALWYHVKELYKVKEKTLTRRNFNLLFHPYDKISNKIPKSITSTIKMMHHSKNKDRYYKSFVSYKYWGDDCDVYGNSLAILFGLAKPDFKKDIFKFINKQKIITGFPVPAMFKPIKENHVLWREYMKNHHQNYPHQYHNGGTWPYISCFYAMALKKDGQTKEAKLELYKTAKLNERNNWRFSEWFHSRTGQAHGMSGQSWNAGAFLLAYHYLYNDININT
ncbi:glycoside hydrolase [Candidatus Parcubacteria bacterium]|nr:MAG: glycoside hydrolase [Candidatus Parcubacteria bacterium]